MSIKLRRSCIEYIGR